MSRSHLALVGAPLFLLTLLSLNGCAALGLGIGDDSDDPVAQAAMQVRGDRAPASLQDSAPEDSVPGQLTRGMSMSSVRSLWGDPQEVDSAGDASLGNQKWTYYNGLSGLGTSESRIVYFENGRVVGWQSQH